VTLEPGEVTNAFSRDGSNGRLYRATERGLFASDDGVSWAMTRLLDGPYAVRVTAVYAQGSLVLAGTSEGLYRSEDGGATFEHLDGPLVHPPWINDIDGEGRHVYVASNEGLRVSHDRGETFAEAGALATDYHDVDVEPGSGRVFVASSTGLGVRTHDGSLSVLYDVASAPGMPSGKVRAVAVTPGAVYAGTEAGLAIFTRDGDGLPVWSANRTTADGLGDDFVGDLAVEGSTVYAVTGPSYYSGSADSFCVSTDGGATFTPRAFAPPVTNRIAAALHVEGPSVYVGAHPGWFLSADGGVTFAQMDLQGPTRITGAGAKLYAGVDGPTGDDGLLVSTDGFRTFTGRGERHGMGQGGGSVDDLVVSGANVYAATGWGIAISANGGTSFVLHAKNTTGAPGAGLWDLSIDCLAVQPGKIWACASNSIDLSTDGGATFASTHKIGSGLARAIVASGSNVYYANTTDVRVSNDGGATFGTRSTTSGLTGSPQDLALAPDGAVYVATSAGVFVSTDDGASFAPLSGVPTEGAYSVDATPGALYVGIGNELGISVDGGETFVWRDASHGLVGTPRETWYQP
jgi:hypothetical protein